MTVYVFNSPILTTYGTFKFTGPVSKNRASVLLAQGFVSAIGHTSTAELLTHLLDIHIGHQRIRVEMQPGDSALVFRLLDRVDPQEISSSLDLEEIGYELAIMERIE